jgi:hypothetical protein
MKLAKRSGFQISATMRQNVYIHNEINDTLVVDLLREEYFARHPELEDNLPPIE